MYKYNRHLFVIVTSLLAGRTDTSYFLLIYYEFQY